MLKHELLVISHASVIVERMMLDLKSVP